MLSSGIHYVVDPKKKKYNLFIEGVNLGNSTQINPQLIHSFTGPNIMCPTIGIMPSGLPWLKRDDKLSGSLLSATYNTSAHKAAMHQYHDYMYSVQYSDHSCYEEIGDLIQLVKPKSMKGIVVSSSCYVEPLYYFGRICGTSQPPELLLMGPHTTGETKQIRAIRIKSYSGADKTKVSKKNKKWKRATHSILKTYKEESTYASKVRKNYRG